MKAILFAVFFWLLAFSFASIAQAKKYSNTPKEGINHYGMVKIPGGEYKPFLKSNTRPQTIYVPSFYMDVHAATNEDFLLFVKANPQWAKSKVSSLFADENYLQQWTSDFEIGNDKIRNSPVTHISWFAANAYCKWKGKRLPTMAEWEYAAAAPPVNLKKNIRLSSIILQWYEHPTPKILPPVESTYKNTYGLYDMNGLIWEWVADFNSIISTASANAFLCAAGALQSTNKEDYAAFMRYAFREALRANYTVASLGFRCACDAKSVK